MKHLIILIILFTSVISYGQAPFTTLVKEPRFLEKKQNLDKTEKFIAITDSTVIKAYLNNDNQSLLTGKEIEESKKNNIELFKSNGLKLSLIEKGENRLSLNSQVLHYKLYVANLNEKNKYRINRYNIPLMVITKLLSS